MSEIDSHKFACAVAQFLDDKLAKDITILNISNVSSLADYFVIATGDSTPQVKALMEEKQGLIEENKELKPKALFADAVSASNESILIGQLAKLIRQNGYEIGQNRLFEWMRENEYLIKKGERYNQPTQKSMDLGLFEVKERTITNPDGSTRITLTTKVTGKGQVYFINKFLS